MPAPATGAIAPAASHAATNHQYDGAAAIHGARAAVLQQPPVRYEPG